MSFIQLQLPVIDIPVIPACPQCKAYAGSPHSLHLVDLHKVNRCAVNTFNITILGADKAARVVTYTDHNDILDICSYFGSFPDVKMLALPHRPLMTFIILRQPQQRHTFYGRDAVAPIQPKRVSLNDNQIEKFQV